MNICVGRGLFLAVGIKHLAIKHVSENLCPCRWSTVQQKRTFHKLGKSAGNPEISVCLLEIFLIRGYQQKIK